MVLPSEEKTLVHFDETSLIERERERKNIMRRSPFFFLAICDFVQRGSPMDLELYGTDLGVVELLTLLVAEDEDEWGPFIDSSLVLSSQNGTVDSLPKLWAEQEILHCTSPSTMFRESTIQLRGLQRYCAAVARDWFLLVVLKPLKVMIVHCRS